MIAHNQAEEGSWNDRRVFAQLDRGAPDGLCVDAEGYFWVAAYGPRIPRIQLRMECLVEGVALARPVGPL